MKTKWGSLIHLRYIAIGGDGELYVGVGCAGARHTDRVEEVTCKVCKRRVVRLVSATPSAAAAIAARAP